MLCSLVDSEDIVMSKNRPSQRVHRAFNPVGKMDIKKKKVRKMCIKKQVL